MYATLWQLYVFISDGLFYTGILNKLLNHALTSSALAKKRDDHLIRLQNAQAFLALAFKTICEFWAGTNDRNPTTVEKENVLNERMDAEGFRQVVEAWTASAKPRRVGRKNGERLT